MTHGLHIENGIEAKIPKRVFSYHELHQVTYRNSECLKVSVKSRNKDG